MHAKSSATPFETATMWSAHLCRSLSSHGDARTLPSSAARTARLIVLWMVMTIRVLTPEKRRAVIATRFAWSRAASSAIGCSRLR